MTKIYKPKTKDDEVTDINMVQVEADETVTRTGMLTLSYLDTEIAVTTTKISELQAKLASLQAERQTVYDVAKTVKLKESEPVEEPESI